VVNEVHQRTDRSGEPEFDSSWPGFIYLAAELWITGAPFPWEARVNTKKIKLTTLCLIVHNSTCWFVQDKWKTLVHTAKISPQQRRGQPVPQELLDRVLAAHAYWSIHQAKHHVKHQTNSVQSLVIM
jgi:hypothetical protein